MIKQCSQYLLKRKENIFSRIFQFSHSVVSDSLQPQGLQHTRPIHHQLPAPSPSLSSFSSRLRSFPASDLSSIPGSARSPGKGKGKYSCLENSMDRGAWWATVHGVTKGHITHHHHYCKFITGQINQFFTKRSLCNDKWTLLMTGL